MAALPCALSQRCSGIHCKHANTHVRFIYGSHVRAQRRRLQTSAVAEPRSGGQGFGPPKQGTLKKEAQLEQQQIQDKLIAVFQSKPQSTWLKLMAFSKQWSALAEGVFKRLEEKTKEELDPDLKLKMRRLLRSLKTTHGEVTRYAEVFKKFEDSEASEYDAIVAGNRDSLTPGFFEYLQHIIAGAHEDKPRQQALVRLGSIIAALNEAFDRAMMDEDALGRAAEKFHAMLQVESLEEAERKIDSMAASGELDPALLLTMAKAYSGVKETDYVKDDVKDLMYHLYLKGKEAAARDAPVEVRILKHLLTLEDPQQLAAELENALVQGGELETPLQDYLSTEPKKLLLTVDTVLGAYDKSRNKTTMLGQTADLMNPAVITRLRDIQKQLHARVF